MAAPFVVTAAMLATATGGTLTLGSERTTLAGFSIDSRSLQTGDLFFAIVGARDGHDYVGAALRAGAAGAVMAHGASRAGLRAVDDLPKPPVIVHVPDTTTALQDLAQHVRRRSRATVVAITGSVGKTTTKDVIAAVLEGEHRVLKNRGNLNNHLGLPLSLLELREGAEVAVMELGMNHPGELSLLTRVAEPDVRVWTNVGDAHLGHFASREAVADAKAEILEGAAANSMLICNADDPLVMARAADFAGQRLTFGLSADADVRASAVQERGLEGSAFVLHAGGQAVPVQTPLLGAGNLSNLLAAAAVGVHLGVDPARIAAVAAQLRPSTRRGEVHRLAGGLVLIDDSYNSSPMALKRALATIAAETRARRKAVVIGEMLELGDHSLALHEECGLAAAQAGVHRLIAVGGDAAQALAAAAVRGGVPEDAVSWTASSSAAADVLLAWLQPGDLVLVKGSRGIRTDAVVDRITAEWA